MRQITASNADSFATRFPGCGEDNTKEELQRAPGMCDSCAHVILPPARRQRAALVSSVTDMPIDERGGPCGGAGCREMYLSS